MRFGYSCLKVNVSKYSKQLMVAAGLLAVPFTLRLEKPPAPSPVPVKPTVPPHAKQAPPPDPRTVTLKGFFSKLNCPVLNLAEDFVKAADENRLDWRLLPSISVVESGGGKVYRNNNILGWNNGVQLFPSIRAGINLVAFKLGRSPLYRNHDVAGKLFVYNPNQEYVDHVVEVMKQISPRANLEPVVRVNRRHRQVAYAQN